MSGTMSRCDSSSSRRVCPEVRTAADQAWSSVLALAGRDAGFRPFTSARLNQSLRLAPTYSAWRSACSSLCNPLGPETHRAHAFSVAAVRLAFELGVRHAWPALHRRGAAAALMDERLSAVAFGLRELIVLECINAAANELWATVSDMADEDWTDDTEQLAFDRWKADVLRRRIWPALCRETVTLLVRPVIELTFHVGVYRALEARFRPKWPGQVIWRFRPGLHCRRHDADAGLEAPPDDPVWRESLPPRSYFCDCWIEVRRRRVQSGRTRAAADRRRREDLTHATPACAFFEGDRRQAPTGFLSAYIRCMQAECAENDGDCADAAAAGDAR